MARKRKRTDADWVEIAQRRVSKGKSDREEWRVWCEDWENMIRLAAFEQTLSNAHSEGREQFSLPTPYNVLHLSRRLLAGPMEMQVVAADDTKQAAEEAEQLEEWLGGFWFRVGRETKRNVKDDLLWWGGVRGRMVLQVCWIGDYDEWNDRRLPIHVRTIDPLNAYLGYNAWGDTTWACHHYEPTLGDVRERWPGAKLRDESGDERDEADTIEVYDYWELRDGKVWNTVIAGSEVVKKPQELEYPAIPFIERFCDPTPLPDEEMRGLSLMFPIKDIWRYQNRLLSQLATGQLWTFWPNLIVREEITGAANDLEIEHGPGAVTRVPAGVDVDILQPKVDAGLTGSMLELVTQGMDQSAYPSVMYGESPGAQTSGYAINLLGSAAEGRVALLQQPLEELMAEASWMVVELVRAFADEPLDVFVEGDDRRLTAFPLDPKDVPERVMCFCKIKPRVPADDQQMRLTGMQEMEANVISRQTYREDYAQIAKPMREEKRVLREQVMLHPDVMNMMANEASRAWGGPEIPEEEPMAEEGPMPPEGMPPGPMPPMPGGPPGAPPGMPPQVMPPQMGAQMMPPPGMDPVQWALLTGQMPPGPPGGLPPRPPGAG